MTKGIEYLIAVGFLFLFIVFWRYINVPVEAVRSPVTERIAEAARSLGDLIGGFFVPGNVYYHPGHAWARVEDEEALIIGVDDFGQKLVGRIQDVKLPVVGTSVRQGEQGWTLQADGKSIGMLSPVDGKVLAVNHDLAQAPEKINKDPYGEGWLMVVHSPRKTGILKGLLSGNLAKRWIEDARANLLARSDADLGMVLTESGPPVEGIARVLDQENWDEIVKEFFLVKEE